MPGNIRFGFYKKREDVKMENKFTAMPLSVPLTENMESAYGAIKEATKSLKGSMGLIYGIYALAFWSSQLLPRWMAQTSVN